MSEVGRLLHRIAMEPPFRLLGRALARRSSSVCTRALWDASERPAYLLGVLAAAEQALRDSVPEICAVEFGVAGGEGLLALQHEAAAVEAATGVRVRVYGFDMGGGGLPAFVGDHRDHPDAWKPGDYPMDLAKLRPQLTDRTELVLGNVSETVEQLFRERGAPPLGFVSVDLDLYSSTRDALRVFTLPDTRMLLHVPMYFDDVHQIMNHRFAGEFLAIDEFNQASHGVKIDRWHGVSGGRPFPESPYLDRMYVAHDLVNVSGRAREPDSVVLPLESPRHEGRLSRPGSA